MANKTEQVIEYIAKLSPGEKVSVRTLSQALDISEGTAYKGIKAAEAQDLVITRPRIGTVRINLRGAYDVIGNSTLAEAARSVGAFCLCGGEAAAIRPLRSLVTGDGSEAQLRDAIQRCTEPALCLLGDRPELQRVAVEMGVNILLTGGSAMEAALLRTASRGGLAVFASEQDSATLIGMLNRRLPGGLPQRTATAVRDWMQMPRYLYHDDMVSEWHRMYSDIFYEGSSCAVVDDHLKICGTVDAMTAMTVAPAIRLSEIMDRPEPDSVVSEDMDMDSLAKTMIRSGRLFAAVSSGGGMSGFINLMDIVRYYQYSQTYRQFDQNEAGSLRLSSDDPDGQKRYYSVELKAPSEEANRSLYLNFICSAAAWHAYDLLGSVVNFDSGTFYSATPLTEPGEYVITSEAVRRSGLSIVLELEMFDNRNSYFKCSLGVSADKTGAD